MAFDRANSLDEERRPDSQPLLEDDRSFSPGSITISPEKTPQKTKGRDFSKWLPYTLTLAYLPLFTLYLILYFKESAPALCAKSPRDVFPCE